MRIGSRRFSCNRIRTYSHSSPNHSYSPKVASNHHSSCSHLYFNLQAIVHSPFAVDQGFSFSTRTIALFDSSSGHLSSSLLPLLANRVQPQDFLSKMPASAASRLVTLLEKDELTGYIVPSADSHQSEYVSDNDKRRAFISGFTGSAGVAMVLTGGQKHRLWTDGRYFLQAARQLSEEWELMKQGLPDSVKVEDFCVKQLPAGSKIGVDASLLNMTQYKAFLSAFKESHILVPLEENLVDLVWGDERPATPSNPLIILADSYTGETSVKKIERVREKMKENDVNMLVVTALDEVAWLLNLRGSDISFNPVFFSYLVLTNESIILFIDQSKITPAVQAHLPPDTQIQPYSSFFSHLSSIASSSTRVWLDPNKTNQAIANIFTAKNGTIIENDSPISLMKAVKNETELKGIRQAHLRDSVAMCQFFAWLEEQMAAHAPLNECSVADQLEMYRSQQKDFVGLSFDTIAGSGANGAIIHYKPDRTNCAVVDDKQLFLLDSGGQYLDGTTDITRTIHLGQPTAMEIRAFTRVLQGHIALSRAIFPPSVAGPSLDSLARIPLWQEGLDYQHGTGHGVGCFLNVHEGPHGIGASVRSPTMMNTYLQAGMIVTNEPGYYHTDPNNSLLSFGIRIENVLVVVPAHTPHRFAGKQYLTFETISLTPISKKLMDVTLMTPNEIEWVNTFHAECRQQVAPLLQGKAKEWLIRETEPLIKN